MTATATRQQSTLDYVRAYRHAGLQCIPIRPDGTKAPATRWHQYQDPDKHCPEALFLDGRGIAILGGRASGNLEIIDFDTPSFYQQWCELVEEQHPGLMQRLVVVATPRRDENKEPGRHVYYRCEQIEGNDKLAMDAPGHAAIETRGEGGYVLAPGSPGRCHPTGNEYELHAGELTDLPTIEPEERAVLLSAARALSTWTDAPADRHRHVGSNGAPKQAGQVSPGDDYASRTSWAEILGSHGWVQPRPDHWRRPGKDKGWSATTKCTSKAGNELLTVFSPNATPPGSSPKGTHYTKFATYAHLNHGGDYTAAASELARQGYGSRDDGVVELSEIMLQKDELVFCGDRGNRGRVLEDRGRTALVHFVSPTGSEATKDLPKSLLLYEDGRPVIPGPRRELKVIPAREFATADYRPSWHVKRVLVAKQPAVCGGRSKAMKTSLLVDLAVSLGSGTPFLGHFETTRTTVSILSGESGAFTIQETARRVAAARGVDLAGSDLFFGFQLPQITNMQDVDATAELLLRTETEVLIVDPAYLCLLSGDVGGRQASNVFDMGPLLLRLSEVGEQTGSTIVLCHHCRKSPGEGRDRFGPPDLEELSMAGFAEWARQWMLIGRREPFEPGTGQHKLWLNVGGSAGFSGTWSVDIEEGVLTDDFTGRRWDVEVGTAQEARDARKRDAERQQQQERERREFEHEQKILRVLRMRQHAMSKNKLRDTAGLNSNYLPDALLNLERKGLIRRFEGKSGTQTCDLYELTERGGNEAKPDEPDKPDK